MSRAVRLGIFIVGTLAAAAAAVFLIGSKNFSFARTYRLYADFQNVAGLEDGADVRVAGIKEGTVKHVYLPAKPGDPVRVEMKLNVPTRDVVRKDSVAKIHSEGLVGDQYVEIGMGTNASPKVNDGDTIGSAPPVQISDLMKKADTLLDSANGVMTTANGAVKQIGRTAGNLDAISGKINQGKGTVGALINNPSAYQHINQAATELQEDMEAMKHNFLTSHFFKKRGYEDAADLTKFAAARMPPGTPVRRFDVPGDKLFDKGDTAKLKKAKLLDDAGHYLETNPFAVAVVADASGPTGDTEEERQLSQARAYTAREYLVQNFKIDDTRVKTMGLGKSDAAVLSVMVYGGAPATGSADRQK